MSSRASSTTREQSATKETSANSLTLPWLQKQKSCWTRWVGPGPQRLSLSTERTGGGCWNSLRGSGGAWCSVVTKFSSLLLFSTKSPWPVQYQEFLSHHLFFSLIRLIYFHTSGFCLWAFFCVPSCGNVRVLRHQQCGFYPVGPELPRSQISSALLCAPQGFTKPWPLR